MKTINDTMELPIVNYECKINSNNNDEKSIIIIKFCKKILKITSFILLFSIASWIIGSIIQLITNTCDYCTPLMYNLVSVYLGAIIIVIIMFIISIFAICYICIISLGTSN